MIFEELSLTLAIHSYGAWLHWLYICIYIYIHIYIYIYLLYIYIYIHTNLPVNAIVRLPYPGASKWF